MKYISPLILVCLIIATIYAKRLLLSIGPVSHTVVPIIPDVGTTGSSIK